MAGEVSEQLVGFAAQAAGDGLPGGFEGGRAENGQVCRLRGTGVARVCLAGRMRWRFRCGGRCALGFGQGGEYLVGIIGGELVQQRALELAGVGSGGRGDQSAVGDGAGGAAAGRRAEDDAVDGGGGGE